MNLWFCGAPLAADEVHDHGGQQQPRQLSRGRNEDLRQRPRLQPQAPVQARALVRGVQLRGTQDISDARVPILTIAALTYFERCLTRHVALRKSLLHTTLHQHARNPPANKHGKDIARTACTIQAGTQ